ncbi:cytochrome c [Methylobacterium sp.]|uniref:c-type cytochrome n=1 Tax=Methylobacterium sp. TaxID=409 RepID=UPI002605B558|nr:cytochrome c [Methylobacterium sp.]MDB5648026.1 cytochrome [Methylobacterium sp.]
MSRTLALGPCLGLGLCLALAGCGEANMRDQPRAKTWDANRFFPQGMTMREPVAGTVPRIDPARYVPRPARIDAALLARGQERYGIACTPCHGRSGDGKGMIVARGFPAAPAFSGADLRAASSDRLYAAITQGHRAMFGMGAQVAPADRWAIVAYVRALQLSQGAEVASLPEEDRAALRARAGREAAR